jgi:hypothetical protein
VSQPAAELAELLGLSDDELCAALEADPLQIVSGELDHRPELGILLALAREACERVGPAVLARWVRSGAAGARPLDLLLVRDFTAFEARVGELIERGLILRGGPGMDGGG